MIELEYVRWALTGIIALVVYFCKRTVDQNDRTIEKLTLELQNVKLNYLHRDDFREFKSELRGLFDDLKKDIKEMRHGS